MVPDQDGIERPAKLTTATVAEHERLAYCGVTFDDGRSVICTMPLSEEEVAAWRQHPDTFFGVVGQRNTRADTLMEMYDFFHESFLKSTRVQLLAAMASAPDFEELSKLDQPTLADIHAERTAIAGWQMTKKDSPAPSSEK